MKTVTITLTLFADDAVALLQRLNTSAAVVQPEPDPEPVAEPVAEPAPKPRKKRAKKAVSKKPEPEPEPEPEAPPTLDELKVEVQQTIDLVGVTAARGVFAQFKAARLSELDAGKYVEFRAALADARKLAE